MIIYESESSRSIESFLRSNTVMEALVEEFGEDFAEQSDRDVIDFLRKYVESMTDFIIEKAMVSVLHCDGETIDIIETNHQVLRFNGNYYDYTAKQFNDSFDDKILDGNIPIVQPIIKSYNQVRPTVSSLKYYVMLGEVK